MMEPLLGCSARPYLPLQAERSQNMIPHLLVLALLDPGSQQLPARDRQRGRQPYPILHAPHDEQYDDGDFGGP